MPTPDDLPRDDAFSGLTASSIHLHPDDIPAAAATAAKQLGLDDLRIFLVDLEQRVLRPFTGAADAADAVEGPDEDVSVEGTLAGRAYRSERPIAAEPDAGRTAVWLPLLDSAERLGPIGATTTRVVDDELLGRFSNFACLVGELMSNKSAYGAASPGAGGPDPSHCRRSSAGRCSRRSPTADATSASPACSNRPTTSPATPSTTR
jgi:hypothetical protein